MTTTDRLVPARLGSEQPSADAIGAQSLATALTVVGFQQVGEARAHVLDQWQRAESFAYVYVLDGEEVVGVLSFRSLMRAPAERQVAELADREVVQVAPGADREVAARLLFEHELGALPVVDGGRMVGVLSAQQARAILDEESTEDAERQGGSAPLEVPYLAASPWLLWRKRILWLLALFAAEAYTGSVLRAFEHELDQVVALTFFIPLLIGTGGNIGTQVSTTIVRAMAVGDVRLRSVGQILCKETATAGLVASAMGLAALTRAWMLGVGTEVALVVTLTIVAIVFWSAIVASVLPPLLARLRVDPAVVSAPLISTLVDGTGLIIYFEVARWILF